MTIKLNAFLIAEYASVAVDGKLTVAGTVDNVNFTRPAGVSADARVNVPLQRAYIVIVTEASIGDGLSHRFRLRVLDGNGGQFGNDYWLDVRYALNPHGRPMRNSAVVQVQGITFPGADDYVFEVSVEGQQGALGELTFSVTDQTGRDNA